MAPAASHSDVPERPSKRRLNPSLAELDPTLTDESAQLPHAELTLDVDLLDSAPIDFWSAVTFDVAKAVWASAYSPGLFKTPPAAELWRWTAKERSSSPSTTGAASPLSGSMR